MPLLELTEKEQEAFLKSVRKIIMGLSQKIVVS